MRRPDGWLSLLTLLALAGLLLYEAAGWPWLPLAYPAVGLLHTATAARVAPAVVEAGSARAFLRRGLLPVLLPLWLFAAVMVPVMLAQGWHTGEDDGSAPFTPWTAWLWLLPLSDPPASSWGLGWTATIWVVRSLLWFVLLSPALLWLFRRWPLRLMAVPSVVLILVGFGLVNLEGRARDVVLGLATYGCCWLLGFGYADGRVQALRRARTILVGGGLAGAGLWVAASQWRAVDAATIHDIPLAEGLFATGFVLVLLQLRPAVPWRGRVLSAPARRTVTAVLWTDAAVQVTPLLLAQAAVARYGWSGAPWAPYAGAAMLLGAVLLTLGWAEVLGRGRRGRRIVLAGNLARNDVPAGARSPRVSELP